MNMGKLGMLNIFLVILAVDVLAKYDTSEKRETDIDGEIDAIVNELELRDIGDESDDSDDLDDDDCECIDICDCSDDSCMPSFCDLFKREVDTELDNEDVDTQARAAGYIQKKIIPRFRFRRFRRFRPRFPRRFPRFPRRIIRIGRRLGKK